MCSHLIYDEIFRRLTTNGCCEVDREKLSSLITDTLRTIFVKDPRKALLVEEILYSMTYHHALINNHLQVQMQVFIYNSSRSNKLSKEIKFDTTQLPYPLCQIIYTFINDLRSPKL